MAHWWLADYWHLSPVLAISWIFWVIFSICCHELGHGYAAIRKGDPTPIHTGHMTWNPVVHMGPWSLLMFVLCGFAWGAMPVSPSRMRGRHADAYVAFAGPLVNLAFVIGCAALCIAWQVLPITASLSKDAITNVYIFLMAGCGLNAVLFLFNLIPVPPLDGSRIVASFVPRYADLVYTEKGAIVSLIGFVIVLQFLGPKLGDLGFGFADFLIQSGVRVFHHP